MIGDLLADLAALRDRVVDRDPVTLRVGFGARDLEVACAEGMSSHVPLDGLPPARGGAAVRLHVLADADVAALRVPVTARLAPYGALLDSVGTDWVVLRNPDSAKLLALHPQSRVALYHPGDGVPPRDRAEFLRPLLHWLAILDGNVVVHAGGVARDGAAVLLAGTGNAGKSTLTRALLGVGYDYLGDNVVEVALTAEAPEVFGVYPTAKIRPAPVLPISPDWPAPLWDDEAEKDIYFLAEAFGAPMAARASRLVATLILEPEAGALRTVPAGEALLRTAPNTVAQFPFFEQEVMRRTGAVLRAAPVAVLGRAQLDEMVAVVDGLVREADAAVHPGVAGGR